MLITMLNCLTIDCLKFMLNFKFYKYCHRLLVKRVQTKRAVS